MGASREVSCEGIETAFRQQGFVATGGLSTTLFLSERLGKPLLLEGPPGLGKTEIGKLWARFHDAKLIRLQCYGGLDEAKALYEWSYGKQMLYAQLLREKTGLSPVVLRRTLGALLKNRDDLEHVFRDLSRFRT